MALYIYTNKSKVPKDIKIVDFNDNYFNLNTLIQNSDLVKDILALIDKAVYNSDKTFVGRTKELGALNKSMLSTGTKTLLNIIMHPDVCFNTIECGSNALEFIPLIKNGKVLWEIPVLSTIPKDKCDIILNETKYFTDFHSLQKYVLEKRGVDL